MQPLSSVKKGSSMSTSGPAELDSSQARPERHRSHTSSHQPSSSSFRIHQANPKQRTATMKPNSFTLGQAYAEAVPLTCAPLGVQST